MKKADIFFGAARALRERALSRGGTYMDGGSEGLVLVNTVTADYPDGWDEVRADSRFSVAVTVARRGSRAYGWFRDYGPPRGYLADEPTACATSQEEADMLFAELNGLMGEIERRAWG